jgi:predicted transcriptional regulator
MCSAFSRPKFHGVAPALARILHVSSWPRRIKQINTFAMHSAIQNRDKERRQAVPMLKAPPKQIKTDSLQLRVSVEFKFKLQRYAQFLEATPSYVVTEALNRIFAKDREFKAWLEQQPDSISVMQAENNSIVEAIRKA